MSYFTEHDEFTKTGHCASINRLNARHEALIKRNEKHIKRKHCLDIASHDGRFTLPLLDAGAKSVIGIEGRKEYCESAETNLKKYKAENYEIVCGDVFEEIGNIKKVDVVFCAGFFYHTLRHVELMQEIERLKAKVLILDTRIVKSGDAIFQLQKEDTALYQNSICESIVSVPSRKGLLAFLQAFGWKAIFSDYDTIKNAPAVYRKGERVSLLCLR